MAGLFSNIELDREIWFPPRWIKESRFWPDRIDYCSLCKDWIIVCEKCGNSSCNGGGCEKCRADFDEMIKLYNDNWLPEEGKFND